MTTTYAQQQEAELLHKWVGQLNEHYLKVADMVPVWQIKLSLQTMAELKLASDKKNFPAVLVQHKTLQQSCNAYHEAYQAITALTYRTAEFSNIKITDKLSFIEHMNSLTKQVNQIKYRRKMVTST